MHPKVISKRPTFERTDTRDVSARFRLSKNHAVLSAVKLEIYSSSSASLYRDLVDLLFRFLFAITKEQFLKGLRQPASQIRGQLLNGEKRGEAQERREKEGWQRGVNER